MKHAIFLLVFLSSALAISGGQATVLKDPSPPFTLKQSLLAMGGAAPKDSVAHGTVSVEAGSLEESGNLTILTRGSSQSSIAVETPHGFVLTYSNGQAGFTSRGITQSLSLERTVTSQVAEFPLPLIAGALADPDTSYRYVGLEIMNGSSTHHLQFWKSFSSEPELQSLAQVSQRDVWIDASSLLPVKISYQSRDAQGSAPAFSVDVFYSDFRQIGGLIYPFKVTESFNGTPWLTISLQNVTLNVGLNDSDFPTQ